MPVVSDMMSQRPVCPLSTRDLTDKIIQFCEAFCEQQLYTYQSIFVRRAVESVLNNDAASLTALWARQCGKTTGVAELVVGCAILLPVLAKSFPGDSRLSPFSKGFKVGIFAPIEEQSKFPFDMIKNFLASDAAEAILSDPEIDVRVLSNRSEIITFSNGSFILAKTASPDAKIEGRTLHLAICEESQDILRTKIEKSIIPMLTSTNGTTIYIGTAGASRGGFHHYIEHNLRVYQETSERGQPVRNHFQFSYDIVIAEKRRAYERDGNIAHLNYEKFVNSVIAKTGKDTPEFKMNYMCLWQESRVIAIRPSVLHAAKIDDLESGPRWAGIQVAGLDIGKVNDPTVLTVMSVDRHRPIRNPFVMPGADEDKQLYYRKVIVDWLELMGSFEGEVGQYRQIVEYLSNCNVSVLCIDATGMGDPVYERLSAMLEGQIVCYPFKFSSVTKSQLYKYYLQELNSGRMRYPGGPDTQGRFEYGKFIDQHLELDKVEASGHVVYQAPEGGHDEYPDSAALACWAEKIYDEVVMPEIEVIGRTASGEGGGESRRRFLGQDIRGRSEDEAGGGLFSGRSRYQLPRR